MSKAIETLSLRLTGAVAASAAFGLIAVQVLPDASLPAAIGLGFLFGTSFIGGTGYRIILATIAARREPAPASWSGATAGAALLALVLWAVALLFGRDGSPVLLGFGVGINIAYLLAKSACLSAGCCHALGERHGVDLRVLELAATGVVLVTAGVLAFANVRAAAGLAIAGHLGVRLVSRRMRGRWSWGWPPLRQPGAEIAPLLATLVAALAPI